MTETESPGQAGRRTRKPRTDGTRTRQAILEEAAKLATIEGLGGLSIGRLAEAVGMSKSGLFAHFGSKEGLQLATIEAATAIFVDDVIAPADAAQSGLERLRLMTEGYLRYVEAATFPGGCFFASLAMEVDTHPGPVRDLSVEVFDDWLGRLAAAVRQAQAEGAIEGSEGPEQLAFELEALLFLANARWVIRQHAEPIVHARRAIERRLAEAAAQRPPKPRR
jgi:AcrR family transcriptional regulator